MKIIVNKLKMHHKGIRFTLIGTFIINLVCTSIFLMFAFGLKDITNETLSQDDVEQMLAIATSIVFVAILCIFFLQWIIQVEIKALFNCRKQFNIIMRLMGVNGKGLRKIYQNELLQMQYIAIPAGLIVTILAYYLISTQMRIPWISIDKIILAMCIHIICVFVTMWLLLRKMSSFEVTTLMRGQSENTYKPIGKTNKILAVVGAAILIVTWILDMFFQYKDMELFYMMGILLISIMACYKISKWFIWFSDFLGLPYISFSERIQIGSYQKTKNAILLMGIGLMLFLGLQSLFTTARNYTREIGRTNLQYESYLLYDTPVAESLVKEFHNASQMLTGLNYQFYIEESAYPKYLYGIEKEYLEYEKLQLDKTLSNLNLKDKLLDPDWNGILLPNHMIGLDNIGTERTININGKSISFVIEGGYYPNVFHKNIWIASKSYMQKQLGQEGFVNAIYLKESDDSLISQLSHFANGQREDKQEIIQKSMEKVVKSTEIVEITSFIIILCAITSIISFIILNSQDYIRDITQFRSFGMSRKKIKLIYELQLINMLAKGFVLGIILAYLFSKTAIYSMFGGNEISITIYFPLTITVLLFLIIGLVTIMTLLLSTRRGFIKDFTLNLRKNDNW